MHDSVPAHTANATNQYLGQLGFKNNSYGVTAMFSGSESHQLLLESCQQVCL